MKYRILGNTGLRVSSISLGTVELGMEYGIQKPGQLNRPDRNEAIYLLQYAVDKGVNLFDTASSYGVSEELIGEAIGSQPDCYIATKALMPVINGKFLTGVRLKQEIDNSIEKSLNSLRREVIDIVQIHNATAEILKQGDIIDALLNTRKTGKIRFIGVSVYKEEEALAAVRLGCFDVIQAAYNILDQRMAQHAFLSANEAGVGIISRSALLKGALTSRANWLPSGLKDLCNASQGIISAFNISWEDLPQFAIRFCLSSEFVHTVLIGASNKKEIDIAINAALEGPLDDEKLRLAYGFALQDEFMLNPSYWPIP